MENSNGVILLIFGIPAVGKTRLVTGLSKESQVQEVGTFVCVHFDDFYPPDLRNCSEGINDHLKSDSCCGQIVFKLKHTRQDINNNLYRLIVANRLGTAGDALVSNRDGHDSWSKFLGHLSSSNPHVIFDDDGK